MPIFNFKCRKCSHEFETLLKTRDEAVQCPECGSAELEKLQNHIAIGRAGVKCANRGSCPAEGSHHCGCGCCHHNH